MNRLSIVLLINLLLIVPTIAAASGVVLASVDELPPLVPESPASVASTQASETEVLALDAIASSGKAFIAAGVRGDSARAALKDLVVATMIRNIDEVLRLSGVSGLADDERTALHDEAAKLVVRALPRSSRGAGRAEALEAELRRLTSLQTAEGIVAQFLGLHPPVRAAQPADALTLRSQLESSDSGEAPLTLDLKRVRVLDEVGGAGAGNQLLDAGEWVQLELFITNTTSLPWFSTSVWFERGDSCVWVDEAKAHELEEMPAGESSSFSAWVYFANGCSAGSPQRLGLRVRDSHRTTKAGHIIGLTLSPMKVPTPSLVNVRFDSDEAGSSDGSRLRLLSPGHHFELSSDLAPLPPYVESAGMTYGVGADAQSLFVSSSFRPDPMLRGADGGFLASDDLDIKTADETAFGAALNADGPSSRWFTRSGGAWLWVAVDTILTISRRTANEPESIQLPEPVVAIPEASEVVLLVEGHLHLVARPVPPVTEGGVRGVDGYDLVFDAAAFEDDYRRLVEPWQPEAPRTEPALAPLVYSFRNYLRVPIADVGPPLAILMPADEPDEPSKEAKSPGGEASFERFVRVDVGGGWVKYETLVPAGDVSYWSGADAVAVGQFNLHATVGRSLVGIVGVTAGWGGVRDTSHGLVSFSEQLYQAGGGYIFKPHALIELMPRVLLDFRRRATVDATEAHASLAVDVAGGAVVRWWPSRHVGAFVAADYRMGAEGPFFGGTGLAEGSGLQFSGGISGGF